jgi:hypothetical protein
MPPANQQTKQVSNDVKANQALRIGSGRTQAAAKKVASKRGRVAEADGRPAVEAWLDRVKPEQQALARRLDQLVLEAVPDAVCAVKFRKPTNPWGVPFYGLPGQGWIAGVNSFKAHVKLMLFAGSALKPMPPAVVPHGRAIDFHSDEELDERQVKAWLEQAKKLHGWGKVA